MNCVKVMDKFESKVVASWWQYPVRLCSKILVPLAILVSVALLYNFERHIKNAYSYGNGVKSFFIVNSCHAGIYEIDIRLKINRNVII